MRSKLRPANKSDLAWITANWARSARNFPAFNGIPNEVFYHNFQQMMETVIPKAAVVVYSWDDPEIPADRSNIGFCVYEKTETSILLHFMYVKDMYRNRGFAKTLWETISVLEGRNHVIYTMANRRMVKPAMYEKFKAKGWLYNPFQLWQPIP